MKAKAMQMLEEVADFDMIAPDFDAMSADFLSGNSAEFEKSSKFRLVCGQSRTRPQFVPGTHSGHHQSCSRLRICRLPNSGSGNEKVTRLITWLFRHVEVAALLQGKSMSLLRSRSRNSAVEGVLGAWPRALRRSNWSGHLVFFLLLLF